MRYTSIASWLASPSFNSAFSDRLSRGVNMDLLFDSDIVNLLLKTKGGRDKKPNYIYVVVSSTLRLVSGGNINMVPDCYGWSQLLLNSL